MRLLQLTSHLNVGGISRYVLVLSRRLMQQGHRLVIASAGGSLESQASALGAAHWHVPLNTSAEISLKVVRALRQLTARLRQEPVDLIHAHTRVAQVVAHVVSRRLGIPYVTTWHGIYRRRLGRRLWPCTGERTIAISELVKQHLQQDFELPESRLRCIYNGIDTAHFATPPNPTAVEVWRARWGLSVDRPVIGGIGRLAAGRVKGFDIFLAAAALLKPRVPGLEVLIVGEGPRRSFLEDLAGRLGVRDQVHFVGEVEDVRVPLAVMDGFVFTSRWPEGFGLTLIEAMAAGKPVIATQAGAVPEVIRHGVDGWLVPSEDPAAIAEGVIRLLNDRAAASRIGRQAQARVREAFDLETMAAKVEAVYDELVPGHAA